MSETSRTTLGRRDLAIALILGATTVLLLLATRAMHQSGDSLAYAHAIKSGIRLFHPHHLLFSPIVRLIYLPLESLLGFDAILVAQLHNVAWAAVAVGSTYAVAVAARGSRCLAAAGAVLLLASQGFEAYATQVEVYLPATGCATLLLLLLTRGSGTWSAVLLLSLLVFYHQTNVLFCVPLCALVAWGGERERVLRAVRIVTSAGALVLATYVVVYLFEEGPATAAGFVDFALRYAVGPYSPQWGTAGNVGGGGLATLMASQLWNLAPTAKAAGASTLLGAVILAVVVWNSLRVLRGALDGGYRLALLLWLIVYLGFFLWWLPSEREFFIITLVPLVLLLVRTLDDLCGMSEVRWLRPAVAVVLAAVCVGYLLPRNVAGTLLPAHRTRGAAYSIAGEYLRFAPAGCMHLQGRQVTQSLRYYFDLAPDDTFNLKLYRRRFLEPEVEDVVPPLPARRCIAVPLFEALPPEEGTKRAEAGPLGLFEFYRWLFRLEVSGQGIAAPAVTARRLPAGPVVLIQEGPPVEFDGLPGFFRSLAASEIGGRFDAFEKWFAEHRDELAGRVDPAYLGADNDS